MTDDGLERLRLMRDEDRGVPPAVGRFGARLEHVEPRSTRVRLPLTSELLLPSGLPTGAVTSLVADIALTTSVVASLPDMRGVTTISMTVDHLSLPPVEGALVSECRAAPYVDGGPQHATGVLRDESGREIARVAGWFLPTTAEAVSAERVGLVNEPPADGLLDLLQVGSGPSFDLLTRDALSNALGSLHGGVGALASQLAAETALGEGVHTLTSTFAYLRPAPRHGSVAVEGSVVRQGRRTGLAAAVLVGPDGRLVLSSSLVAAMQR